MSSLRAVAAGTRDERLASRERNPKWQNPPLWIDMSICINCDTCIRWCPPQFGAIFNHGIDVVIIPELCSGCGKCVEPCPVDCIFMGATHDLSCYSRDGCIVDFSRMPLDVAWGRATLNPTAVAQSKVIVEPVHGGPNQ